MKNTKTVTTKKLIGQITVDSGQILIVDPCYLSQWKDGEYYPDQPKTKEKNDYNTACHVSGRKPFAGEIVVAPPGGIGVASSTNIGDGAYDIYAYYRKEGEPPIRIEIEFEKAICPHNYCDDDAKCINCYEQQ